MHMHMHMHTHTHMHMHMHMHMRARAPCVVTRGCCCCAPVSWLGEKVLLPAILTMATLTMCL